MNHKDCSNRENNHLRFFRSKSILLPYLAGPYNVKFYSSVPLPTVLLSTVCYPMVSHGLEADDPLLAPHQKVISSLTLHHHAYVIHLPSSHHTGTLSSHIIIRRKLSTV